MSEIVHNIAVEAVPVNGEDERFKGRQPEVLPENHFP
jgi:hypothetical protein